MIIPGSANLWVFMDEKPTDLNYLQNAGSEIK